MRLMILLASAAVSLAVAQTAHAESPACRHYVFDRTRCRPDPAQPAPAQPQAEPQAQPEAAPAAPATAPEAPEAPPVAPPAAMEQQALPPAPAEPPSAREALAPVTPPAQPRTAAPQPQAGQAATAAAPKPPPLGALPPVRARLPAPTQSAPVSTAAAAPPPAPVAPAPSAPVVQQATIDPHLVPPYACNFAQSMTLGPAVCQARKVAEARRRVGELVASHRCDQAAQAALATGDTGFAGRVREYCVPAKR